MVKIKQVFSVEKYLAWHKENYGVDAEPSGWHEKAKGLSYEGAAQEGFALAPAWVEDVEVLDYEALAEKLLDTLLFMESPEEVLERLIAMDIPTHLIVERGWYTEDEVNEAIDYIEAGYSYFE